VHLFCMSSGSTQKPAILIMAEEHAKA
jgi:hypothetical protein